MDNAVGVATETVLGVQGFRCLIRLSPCLVVGALGDGRQHLRVVAFNQQQVEGTLLGIQGGDMDRVLVDIDDVGFIAHLMIPSCLGPEPGS